MTFRRGLAGFLGLLPLAAALASAEDKVPIRPYQAEPPTTASPMVDAMRKPPERAILESTVVGPGMKASLRLFSNGLAVLTTEGSDGIVHREHRFLLEEELAVYTARVDALLAPAPASGETRVAEAELSSTISITAGSSDGKKFAWRWTSLDSPPLVAASIRGLAIDLEQAIRDRHKVDDPWRKSPPPDGEILRKVDGTLWKVLRYDDSVDAVELDSVDGQQYTKIPRSVLHTIFAREVEERALDAAPAPKKR